MGSSSSSVSPEETWADQVSARMPTMSDSERTSVPRMNGMRRKRLTLQVGMGRVIVLMMPVGCRAATE